LKTPGKRGGPKVVKEVYQLDTDRKREKEKLLSRRFARDRQQKEKGENKERGGQKDKKQTEKSAGISSSWILLELHQVTHKTGGIS